MQFLAFFLPAFILGTIIGSFLNVVILRFSTGRDLSGRSACASCGKKLEWIELFPVFSFLAQRGRCRGCRSRISAQYILVEIFTGLLFVLIFSKTFLEAGFSLLSVFSFITLSVAWSSLAVIFVYDARHKIIPDFFSALFLIAGLLYRLGEAVFSKTPFTLDDFLAGPLLFLFFYAFWFFSKGRAMGLGDAKLAFGMGVLLGLGPSLSAVVFSFWIGAAVSLAVLVAQKIGVSNALRKGAETLTIKSEVPFGPFLIVGTAIAFFCGVNVVDLVIMG